MAWFLSPSLSRLRNQINDMWPGRDRASDGTLGNAAHAATVSDHNPDANDSVNAIDIDKDGIDPAALIRCVMADWRTSYVIYNGIIRRRAAKWKAEAYSGPNPHKTHVHISIYHGDRYEQSTQEWPLVAAVHGVGGTIPQPPSLPPVVPSPIPLSPLSEEDDMITLIQLLYTTYLSRPGSPAEWLDWSDMAAKNGWNAATLHAKFTESHAEAGTVVAAFNHFLGPNSGPNPSQIAEWSDTETIAQVWAGVKGSPAAKARGW